MGSCGAAAINRLCLGPTCPPEGPTVGCHFSSPDRFPERKHLAVSRNSSFPFISAGVGGGVGPRVKPRESWLFKNWANSQTPLAARATGVFDSGLPISRSEGPCTPSRLEAPVPAKQFDAQRTCPQFWWGKRSDSLETM